VHFNVFDGQTESLKMAQTRGTPCVLRDTWRRWSLSYRSVCVWPTQWKRKRAFCTELITTVQRSSALWALEDKEEPGRVKRVRWKPSNAERPWRFKIYFLKREEQRATPESEQASQGVYPEKRAPRFLFPKWIHFHFGLGHLAFNKTQSSVK
jgi:hypothetical protein